jgi:hypothetical protein
MEGNEALAGRLVRWWCGDLGEDVSSVLADDFSYDTGLGSLDRDAFLSAHDVAGLKSDLKFLNVIASPSAVSVMFEFTDTVTNLYHRCAWQLLVSRSTVTRIWGCSAIIPHFDDVARSEAEARRAVAARGETR